jgi:transcriptional regulator with GAF, ATPase, and Fis domain
MREETMETTREASDHARGHSGLCAVFSGGESIFLRIPFREGRIVIGRAQSDGTVMLPDDKLSRRHAEIFVANDTFVVRDLGSRNGTFVDGEQVTERTSVRPPRVIRVGDTLLVPCENLEAASPPVSDAGMIVGARLRKALHAVAAAAHSSESLLVRGETGTGKELAARTFHANGPRAKEELIVINCAADDGEIAERFARIGEPGGGALFLDEVGELTPAMQAKLLRALEARDAVAIPGSRARVCAATHRDLRAQVAAGLFRADLYHRLAPPEVALPPIRDRRDEIARHVVAEVATRGLAAHAKLVEACLLRPWPGNVRELRKEIRQAAATALAAGTARVKVEHLSADAGKSFALDATLPVSHDAPENDREEPPKRRSYIRWSQTMTRERIERALAECEGNVAHAAKALGMHRTQLYRAMARFAVEPRAMRGPA